MVKIIKGLKTNELPAPVGYTENIGTSNMLAATIDKYLILGGGVNFPHQPAIEYGERVSHKSLHLITPVDNTLKIIDSTEFEIPVSEGASVVYSNMLFYVGGNRILKINTINNKLHVQEYASLPFKISFCIAHQHDGILYYGLGTIDGAFSNRFFAFNLFTKENIELPSFPMPGRMQCVSALFDDEIVVFSGGNTTAYTDGYKYNIKKKVWSTIRDVTVDGKAISILGAGHCKLDPYKLIVIGGFNEEIWNLANDKLNNLIGEERDQFRRMYFSQDIDFFKWNKKVLIYDYIKDTWSSPGEISFEAPCSNALIFLNNNIYSIMGEIKPGIRTPNIYRIPLRSLAEEYRDYY